MNYKSIYNIVDRKTIYSCTIFAFFVNDKNKFTYVDILAKKDGVKSVCCVKGYFKNKLLENEGLVFIVILKMIKRLVTVQNMILLWCWEQTEQILLRGIHISKSRIYKNVRYN